MQRFFHIVFFYLMLVPSAWSQQDTCSCIKKDVNTICYLSVNDFCYDVGGCEHTLDGDFMRNYLTVKLKNPANFGPDGISECAIATKRMPPFGTANEIAAAGCDIFFVGSFAVDTITFRLNSDKTSVPNFMLNAIREWSMACDRNLVVVAQAEAKPWGYTIENRNQNPNTAISDPSKFSVFNGLFGSLTEFLQGGSYQGVITEMPVTGVEILAKDINDRPTVAFDAATKDLVLGDIGILCGQAGFLSSGNQIRPTNDNDILAGNIFALGCQIGQGIKFSEETVYKCEGETITLPNGKVFAQEGISVDSAVTENGCDSFHFIKVIDYKRGATSFQMSQCEGDKSEFSIGGKIFNESFPEGTAILDDINGCDSFVYVKINYYPNTSFTFKDTLCSDSGFKLNVGTDEYSISKPSGTSIIKNERGCDSTVIVNLVYILSDTTIIQENICASDSLLYGQDVLFPDSVYYYRFDSRNKCDSLVIFEISSFEKPFFSIETDIEVTLNKDYVFENTLPAGAEIQWDQDPGLSCLNCEDAIYRAISFAPYLSGKITDAFNCEYPFRVNVKYLCEPVLPNVISASDPAANGSFQWSSLCPVKGFSIRIFDRWGNLMFQGANTTDAWQPKNVVPGVYTYLLEYEDDFGTQKRTGDITVIR